MVGLGGWGVCVVEGGKGCGRMVSENVEKSCVLVVWVGVGRVCVL